MDQNNENSLYEFGSGNALVMNNGHLKTSSPSHCQLKVPNFLHASLAHYFRNNSSNPTAARTPTNGSRPLPKHFWNHTYIYIYIYTHIYKVFSLFWVEALIPANFHTYFWDTFRCQICYTYILSVPLYINILQHFKTVSVVDSSCNWG
jgi:hypothetical protein